jgi:hypothetical protein
MKLSNASIVAVAVWVFAVGEIALAGEPPTPKFTAVTLDDHIQIGYGLAIADVDGDGLPDILLADKKQFVWYRNPGPEKARDPAAWHKYVLAENLTKEDNVCIAAQDIDGDGKCEIAVGAAWNPADTEHSGAVFYLIPPADRTQPWTPVRFPEVEPTTHRMRWVEVEPKKWGLLVVPLHGRGNKNGEGAPVKVLIYYPPADPHSPWKSEVVLESMHMMHNFEIDRGWTGASDVLHLSGREGLAVTWRDGDHWHENFNDERKSTPGFLGIGEIRFGHLAGSGVEEFKRRFFVTVEPMHGNELVVSVGRAEGVKNNRNEVRIVYDRKVISDKLVEGHALACGDFLGLNGDQIVVGWRGKGGTTDTPIGVALWTPIDEKGEQWRETVIDPDQMACEDLKMADLDGDGAPDIIAAGRRTHNVKIYFNDSRK